MVTSFLTVFVATLGVLLALSGLAIAVGIVIARRREARFLKIFRELDDK